MIELVEFFLCDTPEVTAVSIMTFMVLWCSFCEFVQAFIRGARR